jgi:hypothetical protein
MPNRVLPRPRPQHRQHLQPNAPATQLLRQLKKAFLDGLKTCSAAIPATNQASLPLKINPPALAIAARVEVVKAEEKAAPATTDAVANAVANHAAVKLVVKAAKNAPATAKPITVPSVPKVAVKVDADVDVAAIDVVKKRPWKTPPPPWPVMPWPRPWTPPIAHHAKKPKAAVVAVDVASAATQALQTHPCHWQKMRLPTARPPHPTHRQWQAKAASESMSGVNDATVTAMAATVRPAQKSPMTQTPQMRITLGRPQHLHLSL